MLALFTLAFDSSPIKGEGILSVVLALFTLAFDSSPIKGEGEDGRNRHSRVGGNDGPGYLSTQVPVTSA